MSDFASFWNVDEMIADWQEGAGILSTDNDLQTVILISLLPTGWRVLMMIMGIAIAVAGGVIQMKNISLVHGFGCYVGKS